MTRFRQHEAVIATSEAYKVNPRLITVDPNYNIRDLDTPQAKEALEELEKSIEENGIKVPLKARFDGTQVILVQGHRRLRAVMRLIERGVDIQTVPVFPEERATSEIDRTLDLFLSNSGEPLTALEKADGVKRLIDYGWTSKQIADKLGITVQTVYNWEELLGMPEAIRSEIRLGVISPSQAIAMVREAKKDGKSLDSVAATIALVSSGGRVTSKTITKSTHKSGETVAFRPSKPQLKSIQEVIIFIAKHDKKSLTIEQARGIIDEAQTLAEALKLRVS